MRKNRFKKGLDVYDSESQIVQTFSYRSVLSIRLLFVQPRFHNTCNTFIRHWVVTKSRYTLALEALVGVSARGTGYKNALGVVFTVTENLPRNDRRYMTPTLQYNKIH